MLIAERIGDTVEMINNTYGHLYPNRHVEVAAAILLDGCLAAECKAP